MRSTPVFSMFGFVSSLIIIKTMSEESELSDNSINTYDEEQDPPTSKKLKPTPTYSSIEKQYTNMEYLELRRAKFWHIAEEKRCKFAPINVDKAQLKSFNEDYVRVNFFPPFSALCINQKNGHSRLSISKEDCTSATHVCEVAYKESTKQVEDNVKNILITHETVKATVDNCQNLYKIMCITDLEQNLFKFSIEEKQGLPMYEEIENEDEDSQSDEIKRRMFSKGYKPRRIVAPPEYPFAYYRLKSNQECNWCGFCGKNCHNIWYGMFLCSVVTRYHCNHPNDYNAFDAVRLFRETYINLFEFEDYLESRKLEGDLTNYIIPECMLFDSLMFALNSVEWSVMWGHNINSVDSLKTIKMNNSSDNGEHEEEVESG